MRLMMRKIKKIGNSNIGFLSFFEAKKEIPFEIKRIYYIYQVPKDSKRGMHAHKDLEQLLWCPYGEIEIVLFDGKEEKRFLLNSPEKTLYIGNGIWRDMYWKKENSVLCVAASEYYDESDYIRDYDEFIQMVQEGYWENENNSKLLDKNTLDKLKKFQVKKGLHPNSINEVLGL